MLYLVSPRFHLRAGLLMIILVVVLSLTPAPPMPASAPDYTDKLLHTLTHALLMAWFAISISRAAWWRLAVRLAALGVAIECGQRLLPYRHASLADVWANLLGVVLGSLIAIAVTTGSQACGQAE